MATSFEDLMNNMVNVSLGAAAMAADKGKEFLDDLTARGAQVRADAADTDFGRSMADAFERVDESVRRILAAKRRAGLLP